MSTDPIHLRPRKVSDAVLSGRLESLHGALLHLEHVYENTRPESDSHTRDFNAGAAAAYRNAANKIAELLWPTGGAA